MLPHFKNVTPTATEFNEPLFQNLFEVTISFPPILKLTGEDPKAMMINTNSIDLNLTPDLSVIKQKFKYSDRAYVHTPDTTTVEFTLDFYINVDSNFSMKTWNYMKKWYDLGWNSQTGELHYKKDMVGAVTGHIHDRAGVVVRRASFQNAQIIGLDGMAFSWKGNDAIDGKAKFIADYWVDQYYNIGQ
jgi:hypothetical protein